MKNFLKRLLPGFNRAAAEANAPAQSEYDKGFSGPATELAVYKPFIRRIEGATAAAKEGRPQNLFAFYTGLDFNTGAELRPHYYYRSPTDYLMQPVKTLTAAELAACLAPAPQATKQEILDEMLNYLCSDRLAVGLHTSMIGVLLGAGADKDNNDGMPLRIAASRGKSAIVRTLVGAGASFDKALFGAEVNGEANNEVTRKLTLYSEAIKTGKLAPAEQEAATTTPAVKAPQPKG